MKKPANQGKQWQPKEVKELKQLAKGNTPTRVIGLKLGRSEGSIKSKAQSTKTTLKPTNQSPYNRKKHGYYSRRDHEIPNLSALLDSKKIGIME